MFLEFLLRQNASLQVLIWEPKHASVMKSFRGGTCSCWNCWHTGSEGLAVFLGRQQHRNSAVVVLAFTFLAVCPSGRSLKKQRWRISSRSDDKAAPCPRAVLSCRPLHQGWPPRASESESARMKQQSCRGRRSLRSWAAVPSVLHPRPPNECVTSK